MVKLMLVLPIVFLLTISSVSALNVVSIFTGMVYETGTSPKVGVGGVQVEILCNHVGALDNPQSLGFTTSATDGTFSKLNLLVPDTTCNTGDEVYAKTANDEVSNVTVVVSTNIDGDKVIHGDPLFVGVPEFSTATLAIAIVGVSLGIVALRRKE